MEESSILHSRVIPVISFIFLFMVFPKAGANTLDKQSIGFRYTDNVYLMPDEKTADFYLLLNSRVQFYFDERKFRLKFDFADYTKEQDNDYASLSLSTKLTSFTTGLLKSSDLNFKVFHKNYVNENVATSDNSFTHTGAGLDLEREWGPNTNVIITGNAGYESRFFHDLDGRSDHQFLLLADFDFNFNPWINPYAYTDLGFIFSSQAAYSAMFFDFGGGAKGPITKSLSWVMDIDVRAVSYLNRRVDQTMELTKRRGALQTVNVTETERSQTVTLGGGLRWTFDRNFELESRINITSQNSNNPNFEYQNNEIYFSVVYAP